MCIKPCAGDMLDLSDAIMDYHDNASSRVWFIANDGKGKLKGILQANFVGIVGSGSIQNPGLIRIINYSLNDIPNKPEKFACGKLHRDHLFLYVKFHMRDCRRVPGAAATKIELARKLKEFSFKETGLFALKYTSDVACTVLQVDQIVLAKPAGGLAPRRNQGPADED